jgi:hypothetical protein
MALAADRNDYAAARRELAMAAKSPFENGIAVFSRS